jgi:hypothetical protein
MDVNTVRLAAVAVVTVLTAAAAYAIWRIQAPAESPARKRATAALSLMADNVRLCEAAAEKLRQRAVTLTAAPLPPAAAAATTPAAGDGPGAVPVSGLTGKGASGYYAFTTKGEKLKSKWDTFDVDAELAKLDEEGSGAAPAAAAGATRAADPAAARAARVKEGDALLRELGRVDKDVEDCLLDTDSIDVGVDAGMRDRRRAVVKSLQRVHAAVDELRASVERWRVA